jgi:two-component system, cell cycle sensor histidine kinase and response regulator CckA
VVERSAKPEENGEQGTIEQLHSIVEHTEANIFLIKVTEDGTFQFETLNPVGERLVGMKSEAVRGRTPEQLMPAEEARRITENYRRCVELAAPITYEESPGAIAGGHSFRTTLVPVRDGSGRVHRLIGLAHDITEQKQAEDALAAARASLHASEEKFRKAFRASPHPIGITELESGRLLEVNDAFERVFGYVRAEALGKTTVELGIWKHPEERLRMFGPLEEDGCFRDLEIECADRLGRRLFVSLSGELIEVEGKPCLVTYVHDLTAHQHDKLALEESEEKFSRAFRASPDAQLIVENASGRLIEVNGGCERLFERTREELVGRTSLELGLWLDPLERERAVQILLRTGSLRDFAIVGVTSTGEHKNCMLSGEAIEIGGRPHTLVMIRDVTDKVRAERERSELEQQLRQVQKMEALGTLAGGIAHDFNNILAAMLAYAELIKVDIAAPVQISQHLHELKAAGDRAKDLIRQILTFSRRQPQQRKPVKLDALVEETARLLRSTLSAKLRIEVAIAPDTPVVLADASQIHQVLLNLGTNAAHAVGKQPGELGVRLETVDVDAELARVVPELQARRYARITVRDSGHGMAPATLKRIFEPFFTTKPVGEGTGLGLAVVHGIVREHEGAILVESELGKGTTFSLYFPQYHADLAESVLSSTTLARGHGEPVLLVDDEVALCRSLSNLLERLDYRVLACSDPLEAVARFRAAPDGFRLVLTDLTMPTLSGFELSRILHDLRPALPIVAMTGFSSVHTSESLGAFGIVELISKPLNASDLAEVLERTLRASPVVPLRTP